MTTGGVQGLQAYVQATQFQVLNTTSGQFRLYSNGTVTDVKGVFVTTGGVNVLNTYLATTSY